MEEVVVGQRRIAGENLFAGIPGGNGLENPIRSLV
jgi:hypothetical protein